ncbi:MAG: alpha/beta hydrolase [Holophagales bacterium]|nr:alpha/beta hydrolase [Holophagales bacterium]
MKSLVLESPEATIRFHDLAGVGTPLVFVHGLGCASSCDYPAVARDPSLASRRAILVDLLGSGFSDRPEGFDYSVSAHARVLVALIDALGVATCDLYGHSMGGAVAIVAATMLPGRVEHLVLSEPNLDPGGGVFSRSIAAQPEARYVANGHAETIREAARSGNDIWAGSMAATAPFAAHRGAVSLVEGASPSWRRQLLALDVPRTVLFGARSLPDPDAESLPAGGVGVAVVPDAGHSMAWENPSGLARAIAGACSSRAVIEGRDEAFLSAARHVIEKNAELYRRLS